jgi:copper(I)-binding protein
MKTLLFLAALAASAALAQSHGRSDIEVQHPWSRATPPGAKVGAGYMEIHNRGAQPDRLIAASTPAAQRVELHISERQGDVARMRQVKSYEIPARGRYVLQPGGAHLMLFDLARPLEKGERVKVKLRFERAGELEVELEVRDMGSREHRH